MKHYFLYSMLLLAGTGFVHASPLTPQEALARLQHTGMAKLSSAMGYNSAMKLNSTIGSLYVFDSPRGFAILPDDDRAPALLGYSDGSKFSLSGNPELQYWLDYYNSQMEIIKRRSEGENNSSAWRSKRNAIFPILTTEWNQEAPYNLLCPKVDGHETVTGCVATAMAQVLKYHNYPAHGKGTHSYFWRPGEEELTFDYENTPFEWSLMTDRYDSKSTEASKEAVAKLMLACGVSVDMHYEPGGSGAATTAMGEALINIFNYSPSLWMPNREFYGLDEWEGMIYADLAQGLPVLYSGAGTAGGHQFICDGYDGDGYFHFNWGWGGLSNGYFLLTALNPDDLGVGGGAGGFNSSQVATLGVRLPQEGDKPTYVMYNTTSFLPDKETVKAGEDLRCSGLYYNYSLATLPEASVAGMKFTSEDGSEVKYVPGPGVSGLHLYDGRRDIQIKFPELADGTYLITAALRVDDKWSEIRTRAGSPSIVTAVVKDNVATLTAQSAATVTITDIEMPSVIYRDRDFPLHFTATNSTNLEFYATVTPYMVDATGKDVAKSTFRPLDVLPGAEEVVSDYIADFSAIEGEKFPAGDYKLIFRDEWGRDVSEPLDVTVGVSDEKTEIKVTDARVAETEPVTDPENVKFTFTLTCESGVYYDAPRVLVFPGDGGDDIYNKSSERIYLTKGESQEVTITANLSELKDGHYMAAIYDGGRMMSDILRFTIKRVETGAVSAIDADSELPQKIYTLDGVECHTPLSPGMYIINGKVAIVK